MARTILTRSRIFGIGLASAVLAFAACGHSDKTPTVTPTATESSVVSVSSSSAPCILSLGIAFEPDAGNGNGAHGIQVVHYEGNDQNTCAYVGPTATPAFVSFSSSVGEFVISATGSDGRTDAAAVLQNSSGGYSLVQDVFGAAAGILVPAGTPYDASVSPPTTAPSAGATAAATATPPLIPDITSITTIGGGITNVALIAGPAASPPGIVAITSLDNAPPEYGLSVPYFDTNYGDKAVDPSLPRSIVRVASATTSDGTVVFARGVGDLLVYKIINATNGYEFNATQDDLTLGTGVPMRGLGDIAFDPADGTRALIGSSTSGGQTQLTLVDGLPDAITHLSAITLPGKINSLFITPNGDYAVVATSVGIVVVDGVGGSELSIATPFEASPLSTLASSISYVNCNGTASKLTNIYSIALANSVSTSTTNQFLVALGSSTPAVSCASGNDATLVALPFDVITAVLPAATATPTASPTPAATSASATPSPSPTPSPPAVFVQNNVIAPPAGSDVLVVK